MNATKFKTYVQISLTLLFLSCEKESKESILYISEIEIDHKKNGMEIPWDGYNTTFDINCNTDWSIDVLSSNGGGLVINYAKKGDFNKCDWIQIFPSHGSGNGTINLSVAESSEIESRDAILVIHTNDGRCTENIWLLQNGKDLSGLDVFEVFPQNDRFFNGRANDIDSLYVICPNGAFLYGPSWIEISINSSDWKPLSETKSRDVAGYGIIALRTAKTNKEENDLEGIITVTHDNNSVVIPITQMGRLHVSSNKMIATADGFACDWRYGCDVTSFYLQAFEGSPSTNELRWERIKRWQKFDATDGLVIGWSGKKEQTRYEVIAVGTDDNNDHNKSIGGRIVTTGSSINQPRVSISDVYYTSPSWQWETVMNENAACYYQWIYEGSDIDDVPDAWVKWVILNNIHQLNKEAVSSSWTYNFNGNIHIATLAIDNTDTPSNVIDRYKSSNNKNRTGTRMYDCVGIGLNNVCVYNHK